MYEEFIKRNIILGYPDNKVVNDIIEPYLICYRNSQLSRFCNSPSLLIMKARRELRIAKNKGLIKG